MRLVSKPYKVAILCRGDAEAPKPPHHKTIVFTGADAAPFQALKAKMEDEWPPQMMEVLGIDRRALSGTPMSLRPPDRIRRRQLRLVRHQCQFVPRDPGAVAGGDHALGVEAVIE